WYGRRGSLTAGGGVRLFFFQAEDGIRDRNVTGVQTCALPISSASASTPIAFTLASNSSNKLFIPVIVPPALIKSSIIQTLAPSCKLRLGNTIDWIFLDEPET